MWIMNIYNYVKTSGNSKNIQKISKGISNLFWFIMVCYSDCFVFFEHPLCPKVICSLLKYQNQKIHCITQKMTQLSHFPRGVVEQRSVSQVTPELEVPLDTKGMLT